MKNKTLIKIYIFFLLITGLSCSKEFLDKPPEDSLTLDNYYKTDDQVNASTAALYNKPWFDFHDNAMWSIGEIYSGNMRYTWSAFGQFYVMGVTSSNNYINEAWRSLFSVVAHSNSVINNIPVKAGAAVSESLKKRVVAEARFMRATAYFYLVRIFGPVPIIENNTEIAYKSKIPRNLSEDVFKFIIMDLQYAKDYCEDSYSGTDLGRITSWAAKGMLAKVYLCRSAFNHSGGVRNQSDLDSAKFYAGDVINNSGLGLVENYEDLFKYAPEYENSEESLFALQWVGCQSWSTQNTLQSKWAKNSTLTGTADGWGGGLGPTPDLQDAYESGDARRHWTIMQDGDYYPELVQSEGGYLYVVEPNDKESESGVFASIRKYLVGTPDDNSEDVCLQSNGLNTYILRLADVYLIYAEAVLGNNASTADGNALTAYNDVRTRANLDAKSEITFDDILQERRIEFAMESSYWFDLLNLYYFNPEKAKEIINSQERGSYDWTYDNEGVQTGPRVLETYNVTVSDDDFTLPIPLGDLDQNPLLLQDPVAYDFGE